MRTKKEQIVNGSAGSRRLRPGDPLHERFMKSEISFHNIKPMHTNLSPDYHAACTSHRIARMVTENFTTIGDYVKMLMKEFQGAASCRVFVAPKNIVSGKDFLEHRLSVIKRGEKFFVEERAALEEGDGKLVMPLVENAFLEKRPVMLDYEMGLKIFFGDLDMDSDSCDVYPIDKSAGEGSLAIMPFYYRDPAQPSGVVVFEGDLRCNGSDLEGFAKTYWSAKAAIASAAQLSFLLTHKFDAITILTKVADFNVDFEECIQQLMERKMKSLYLVLLDLDDFKNINDEHGYNTGNGVLKKVAETIKASVREKDRVSRWGGEEFVALLQDVNEDEAKIIAERIRRKISEIKVRSPFGDTVTVTCSIGVSNVDNVARKMAGSGKTNGEAIQSISDAAFETSDRNLKNAKRNGKNRISFDMQSCACF